MSHYIVNFLLTSGGIILLLYVFYLYVKHNPQLGTSLSRNISKSQPLHVESVLELEPRKRLYVVREGQQRFLLATSMDKTELLTSLESAPECEMPAEATTTEPPTEGMAKPDMHPLPSASFAERFRYSLKMVFADRFSRYGGK